MTDNNDNNKEKKDKEILFTEFELSEPVLKAVAYKGYKVTTSIQAKAIPIVLEGKDIMAAAQTGTGKTAAFTLPILDLLAKGRPASTKQARVLILAPTRELAAQIGESVKDYGKFLNLRSAEVFGGVRLNPQIRKCKEGVDILVATPGRLLDLYQQGAINFKELEILVLDEADRMLDMGFIHDIKKIIAVLPARKQTLMFSATFSKEIRRLATSLVRNPVEISVTPQNAAAKTVEQVIHPADKNQKGPLLIHLLKNNDWEQVLVFCRTKHGADRLTRDLKREKIKSAAIHGNKTQGARTKALEDFKNGKVRILVATDIAARGIDIEQLPLVVNFDLPHVPEDYVHRIGRTGRAGMTGKAFSLVSSEEFKQLSDLERLIQQILPRKVIQGFSPTKNLPDSSLDRRSSFRPNSSKWQKNNRPGGNRSRGNSNNRGHSRGNNRSEGNSQRTSRPNGQAGQPGNRSDGNRSESRPTGNSQGGGQRSSGNSRNSQRSSSSSETKQPNRWHQRKH
ncbi:ATP-dependent RNA helicase [Candidatus Marinamargulisbacteria bacterium SCGC AAA071-K20]|nr:ATP-dependent RNA helicase [Candidatus Marinamargulisbacteria bacterium SCGC AAA071-K20]